MKYQVGANRQQRRAMEKHQREAQKREMQRRLAAVAAEQKRRQRLQRDGAILDEFQG